MCHIFLYILKNDVPSNVIIERGKSVDVIAMSNEILRSLIHLKVEVVYLSV